MPKNFPGWRAQWYVYNHVTREFVRSMTGRTGVQWTPGLKYARPYKNPAMAQKCASRLNAMLHHPESSCWPCQPVSVVTGEAARCLDLINRRDGKGNDLFRPDAARRPTFP